MIDQYIEYNKLLKGTYMGIITFDQFLIKTNSDKIKELIENVLKIFREHEEILIKEIEDMNEKPCEEHSMSNLTSEVMIAMKNLGISDDVDLIKEMTKAINMGQENLVEYKHQDLKEYRHLEEIIDKISQDYSFIQDELNEI